MTIKWSTRSSLTYDYCSMVQYYMVWQRPKAEKDKKKKGPN